MAAGTAGPTFLILGAPKAGTTALYRWLQQHPAVFMPANKQPHYFAGIRPTFSGPGDAALNRDIVTDRARYLELFAPGAARPARGEASPFYLHYAATAAPRIRAACPECRLVILLREPVARAWAGYLHLVRDGRERGGFRQAIDLEEERLARGWEPLWGHRVLGLYGRQLAHVRAHFPSAQVGVWLYDELRADPRRLFAEVCRFIGVDPGFVPEFSRHNTGGVPRHPALHAMLVRLRVPHLAKWLLPERTAQWVVSRYLDHRPPPPDMAEELRGYFADDRKLLESCIGPEKLSAWKG